VDFTNGCKWCNNSKICSWWKRSNQSFLTIVVTGGGSRDRPFSSNANSVMGLPIYDYRCDNVEEYHFATAGECRLRHSEAEMWACLSRWEWQKCAWNADYFHFVGSFRRAATARAPRFGDLCQNHLFSFLFSGHVMKSFVCSLFML
jgi:hypothetical protein